MRVAIIADVHGNAGALDAVLDDIDRAGCEAILNLGDHVSGPLEPGVAAARLMSLDALSIRGNHDRTVLADPREEMDLADRVADGDLTERQRAWLAGLPETAVWDNAIFLCHGTPTSDDTHWLQTKDAQKRFHYTPAARIEADAAGIACPVICCGHSHVARVVVLSDGRQVVNPGSVGRPAYAMAEPDSAARLSPDAGYAIADHADGVWTLSLRQVRYDHERAARLAEAQGGRKWVSGLREGWRR